MPPTIKETTTINLKRLRNGIVAIVNVVVSARLGQQFYVTRTVESSKTSIRFFFLRFFFFLQYF